MQDSSLTQECPNCDSNLERDFSRQWSSREPIKAWSHKTYGTDGGLVLEHVEKNPKRFRSEKELRAYAKKHNYSLGALL